MADTGWIDLMVGAWNANDGETTASFFAPDGRYEDVGAGRVWEGREAIAHMISVVMGAFAPDSTFDVVSTVYDDSGYAFQWHWAGTHKKTGRTFELRGASIGQLRDGLIVRHFDYWNLAHLTDQLAPTA